jgi:hypothetical protein
MHVRQNITLGVLLLLLAPLIALAQFPPGGGGKKMKGDPNQMWERMVGAGKDVWLRSDAQNGPGGTFFFDRIAQDQNITTGQITKQQFMNYMEQMRARFGQGKGPGGGGPGQPVVVSAPTPDQTAQWDREAEADFRQRDQNGDGKLNEDEMPRPLRNALDKWDINKDGQIDLNEYKAYYRDRMTNRMNNNQRNNVTFTTDAVVDDAPLKRPDVYRYGNMPANLPAWFAEIDTDQDGQIGLYEWKAKGWPTEQFRNLDRNDDGFLTVDEVLR